ncbi:cyclin-dependent kinase 7-like [Salvia splendens]|uniref:cyclin-dependent kinase 7-like n=1 Tax=Salvia splendens TaxID=180675 RepID=UPI001C2548E4|nr:cyclin-dependent kinase 7-like [Salvia splendens]
MGHPQRMFSGKTGLRGHRGLRSHKAADYNSPEMPSRTRNNPKFKVTGESLHRCWKFTIISSSSLLAQLKAENLQLQECGRMSLDRTRRKWYRAPELLMGETNYTGAIDMWAVGCLKAELVLLKVLFPGNSEIEQLSYIHLTLGPTLQMMLSVSAPKLEWIF